MFESKGMSYQLVLCEKPSAAAKIASALAEGKVQAKRVNGVPTYRLERGGRSIVVVPAIGHLFTVAQRSKGWSFPVFDTEWTQLSEGSRAWRGRAFLETISKLSKGADAFVSACDYDTEGSLIAYMILRYACGGADVRAGRMKFSTLTKADLQSAYENMARTLDFNTISAGKARHELDWLFGINVSRALMDSLSWSCHRFQILSAGRVQSPTLNVLHKRELSINLHVPDPFWTIGAEVGIQGAHLQASYMLNEILSRQQADGVAERCNGKEGTVSDLKVVQMMIPPPYPFNLTDLQKEAYRLFRFTPSRTQKIAERLYLDALISYPRTSSQRLPSSLGLRGIIQKLSADPRYGDDTRDILSGPVVPRQGPKTDQAHPAIHPTGKLPSRAAREDGAIFDLIVRRFLATFGPPALREKTVISVLCGESDIFKVTGYRTVDEGWMRFYKPYSGSRDVRVPQVATGDHVLMQKVWREDRQTAPPLRFNPGSILGAMERSNLGTKATRAEILDTLYRRGYIEGVNIKVTELGLAVVPVLKKFFPELASTDLTKKFGDDMEGVEAGNRSYEQVLGLAIDELKPLFERAISRYEEIGGELFKALSYLKENECKLGQCPSCGEDLIVVRSRKTGKRFLGCSGYSRGCRFSLPLPQRGRIIPTNESCKSCGLPIVEIKGSSRKPWRVCVNDKCPAKRK